MGSKTTTTTEVEIFGQVYPVRGEHDREHLQELAAQVDRTMRQIADRVTTVDTAKIAILAALNLADELSRSQRGDEGEPNEITERMVRLTERLTAAVGSGDDHG